MTYHLVKQAHAVQQLHQLRFGDNGNARAGASGTHGRQRRRGHDRVAYPMGQRHEDSRRFGQSVHWELTAVKSLYLIA